MKQLLTVIIYLILGGCARNQIYQDKQNQDLAITAEDSCIGFSPVYTKICDNRFDISFQVPPISVENAEKYLIIVVTYDVLSATEEKEKASLVFKGVSPDNVPFVITLNSMQKKSPPTEEDREKEKKIKDLYKSLIVPAIGFLIEKKDFEKLLQSKEIEYIFTSIKHNIKDDFSPISLSILQRNGKVLLAKKPYKPQTFDEMKKDMDDVVAMFKEMANHKNP